MSANLVTTIMHLPIFEAAWVLWLLIGLSLASVMVMLERIVFYATHAVDAEAIRSRMTALLDQGDHAGAARLLAEHDSLETNVVLFGLRQCHMGADAVEDLIAGAQAQELGRFRRRLNFLATVGNNAPFIGLFGTVLGIIHAFADLARNGGNPGNDIMTGISESLVATGIGLLVAIPAVVAYNLFTARVNALTASAALLSKSLLARLKSETAPADRFVEE
jgi:biopolymer transport protein ExbB